MPDLRPANAPPAATPDDLDAQCRGIGTCAARATAPSARAAHRAGPAAGAGMLPDASVARPAVRDGQAAH
jgi:hypothetical protein